MDNQLEIIQKAQQLYELMKNRRSTRAFSSKEVPLDVLEYCIKIASSAPSGANMQPWSYVLVKDAKMKNLILNKANKIEKQFFAKKITPKWRKRLEPLNLDIYKNFLIEAPYLICVFMQKYGYDYDRNKIKHYYPNKSMGIATGFLISSLHQCRLSTLTYTPSPMTFLSKVLNRPENERPYMIVAVGYSSKNYIPPDIVKKGIDEVLTII